MPPLASPPLDTLLPVFVYGLLRPGEAGFAELGLADCMDDLGVASVGGTLIDLGDYPGALPGSGAGTIAGHLLMPRTSALFSTLDAYELFDPADPAGSEYLRVAAVTRKDGVRCWIYAFNGDAAGFPVIASGDWLHR